MQFLKKFVGRHLSIFALVVVAIFVIDILLYGIISQNMVFSREDALSPEVLLENTFQAIDIQGDNITIADAEAETLAQNDIWAMFLSSEGEALWTQDLPYEVPTSYSIQDVALFTRGYLMDYPVFVQTSEKGILVLGYPMDSYSKLLPNYYPIDFLKSLPIFFVGTLVLNLAILFAAYFLSKRHIMNGIEPVVSAMDDLSHGKPVEVTVKGDLEAIGISINQTSKIIQNQNSARANWISGVSHDIRTPLSMIMGYAGRICEKDLPPDVRAEAEVIRNQSKKISLLIQDLNLVSQLEYEMQPLQKTIENPAKLLREVTTEYLNDGIEEKYSLVMHVNDSSEGVKLEYDHRLLKRAIQNLVNNSVTHNPDGCDIRIEGHVEGGLYHITVADNGVGVTGAQLRNLNTQPHYMSSTDSRLDLRHGLGLLLVGEIVKAHDGSMQIDEKHVGFKVQLSIPVPEQQLPDE